MLQGCATMALRLVSPIKRKGSQNIQFVQRIPADLKGRAGGLKLAIPVGAETISFAISEKADALRVSYASDASVVKVRQGQVAAYVETVWRSLRGTAPIALTHRPRQNTLLRAAQGREPLRQA
ncbi:hypothetical protein MESS2_1700004 [Mesorhizobium metallidurans STM 2683]|uniref:Uncharacterized protein n=1 Tax=Mesorhizobium metallidurans STM 2683 TaxID=1297569 RepID=M5ENI5_9HYPH|nr:hypothetical protein MESS2_1700004 [Mesorhizobium metallidurans STM 2683]